MSAGFSPSVRLLRTGFFPIVIRIGTLAIATLLLISACALPALAQQTSTIEVEVTNPNLQPSHWKISLDQHGHGQFDAEAGNPPARTRDAGMAHEEIVPGAIHRPIQLSPEFATRVFTVARQRKLFAFPCESHMKVAFQGTKHFSYSGPDGNGACEFNYSKDKAIQDLGDAFIAVESTMLFGARLEMLLQHDRLGLDQEMEDLAAANRNGNAIEMGVIRETLEKIASDDQVLERARRKARLLLATIH